MKTTAFLALSGALTCLAPGCAALSLPFRRSPSVNIKHRDDIDSTTANNTAADQLVLSFALNLEHLESAFYSQGLERFSDQDFQTAGLPASVRGRFEQIANNEKAHVDMLTQTLGNAAMGPCNYSFPFSDPNSFVIMAGVLEGIGASAYIGAASHLSVEQHQLDAASILATESRQAAYILAQVRGLNAWDTPFETPLTMNQAFSLVSSFIVPNSCPQSTQVTFTRSFPTLVAAPGYIAGGNITLQFDPSAQGAAQLNNTSGGPYLAILTGLGEMYAPLTNIAQNLWTGQLPEALQNRGTVYAVVTRSNSSTADADTVAGVLVLQFPYGATVTQGL